MLEREVPKRSGKGHPSQKWCDVRGGAPVLSFEGEVGIDKGGSDGKNQERDSLAGYRMSTLEGTPGLNASLHLNALNTTRPLWKELHFIHKCIFFLSLSLSFFFFRNRDCQLISTG